MRHAGKRSFDRSEYVGFRCPGDVKAHVKRLSSLARRDISSLMIEWASDGAQRLEADLRRKQLVNLGQ